MATPKLLAQVALNAALTTHYTVPLSTRTVLKEIVLCNTSEGSVAVDLYLVPSGGTAGVANALTSGMVLAAKETRLVSLGLVLEVGTTLQGVATQAGLVGMTVSGVEDNASATAVPVTGAVRQTVLAGAVDANGQANFLQAGTGLTVNLLATTVPVELSFAAGFNGGPVDYFGRITTDITVSGLTASATNYLYTERDPGTGSLTCGCSTSVPFYTAANPVLIAPGLIPTMTSNTAPSGTASAGSIFSVSYDAYKAFDQESTATYPCWVSNNTQADTLTYAFSVAKSVSSYSIQVPTSSGLTAYATAAPKNWTLKGSNDNGATWTTLDTQTNQVAWGSGETRTFLLASAVSYSQYRLDITANNGAAYIGVEQFQVYGISVGQHWFDLSTMTMKAWTGSTWGTVQRVFVGEVVTSGTGVTSVTTYALRGRYTSGRFSLAAGTTYSKSHNLGVNDPVVIAYGATVANGSLYPLQFYVSGSNYGAVGGNYGRLTASIITLPGGTNVVTSPSASAPVIEGIIVANRNW